jgi:hypothetical protein
VYSYRAEPADATPAQAAVATSKAGR